MPATRSNRPKRVRFTPDPTNKKQATKQKDPPPRTPTTAAKETLSHSLESRQDVIATIMHKHGSTLLVLHTSLHKKKEILSKMQTEDDYIPASCRTNFCLQLMKKTEERDPEKATELKDSAVAAKTAYEAAMKNIIIGTAQDI